MSDRGAVGRPHFVLLTRRMLSKALLSAGLVGVLGSALSTDRARTDPLSRPVLLGSVQGGGAAAARPGVAVSFSGVPSAGGAETTVADHRVQRLLALRVAPGAVVSPFVAGRNYVATFRGLLRLDRRLRLKFSLVGTGAAELRIDDRVVAQRANGQGDVTGESIRWKKGDHVLQLTYTPPASGEALLRVEWESRKFGREPVSPTVLWHTASPELSSRTALRRGRELLAQYQCVRCHAPTDPQLVPNRRGMPELHANAPSLVGIGSRVRRPWLEDWIRDPKALRRHARMPKVLPEATAAEEAKHLAAYLVDAGPPPAGKEGKFKRSQARSGGRHFRAFGCIGCHVLPGISPSPAAVGVEAGGADDRIELTEVDRKWRPEALVAFLRDPSAAHPATRMPNFALSPGEATELAAFLLRQASRQRAGNGGGAELDGGGGGDSGAGRKLYRKRGCLACHGEPRPSNTQALEPMGKPLAELSPTSGCLGASAAERGPAPDYDWNRTATARADRSVLADVFAEAASRDPMLASLALATDAEFAERQVRQLRCEVCHSLDGRRASLLQRSAEISKLPELELGEEEVLQDRPALTFAGEKLRPDWMVKLFGGRLDRRARPWLHMRMPAFASRADRLAAGLADQHGFGSPADPGAPGALAVQGKRLVGKAGFACTTCHSVGEAHPDAVFEVLGVNLALVRERLRPGFYRRWMRDPRRIDPSTRMPQYADDAGKTAVPILGSDAAAQFDAIFDFLRAGRDVKL